jgi:proteasome lid subunit RPN8/RPN11
MEIFRITRDGHLSTWLSDGEVEVLRALVLSTIDLLGGDRKGQPQRSVMDELAAIFEDGPEPQTPADPALARLLPDAYIDDPDKAGEFRRYTEDSLREAKKYFAQTLIDTLPAHGGRVKLTDDQARDWLRAINDVRLTLGVRLEVTEEFEEQLATLDPEDPVVPAFQAYGWLGALQDSLLRALRRGDDSLPSMLTISRDLYDKILAHARKDHPDEACGVIAGPSGSGRPERFIPMDNAARSPTFYEFDSMEQLRVWNEMDDRDEEPVVIYHSHTMTEAYPSPTDISYAHEPGAHYVLVSTREPDTVEFRSYRIIDGEVTEEPVEISE